MNAFKTISVAVIALCLSACATWSTASVKQSDAQKKVVLQTNSPALAKTPAADIKVIKGEVKRKYISLGEITATANKTTAFNQDPTEETVNARLREEAAKLGADAVIHARYGKEGVSFMSWGTLEGKGLAIKYVK